MIHSACPRDSVVSMDSATVVCTAPHSRECLIWSGNSATSKVGKIRARINPMSEDSERTSSNSEAAHPSKNKG